MKVTKNLLGKYVEVTWRDPTYRKLECNLADVSKGIASLAYWRERGIIDDITDDIVRIQHSECSDTENVPPDVFCYTWVHAALIERIRIFEPITEEKGTVTQ